MDAEELSGTYVIFDASANQEPEDARIAAPHVRFAIEHDEADDLLEELIRAHAHPKTLLVVSSDHRIQRCARARKCQTMDSIEFLAFLDRAKNTETEPKAEVKPSEAEMSVEEVDYWLGEFKLDE